MPRVVDAGSLARDEWTTAEADRPSPARRGLTAVVVAGRAGRSTRTVPDGPGPAPSITAVTDKATLRVALEGARRSGFTVGLVPTMGALHDGHTALVRRAAAECDVVAVTVFVNPLQFDRPDDLAAYPRTLADDVAVAGAAGASIVFAPTVAEVYGVGPATRVHVEGLADRLEGAARPGHFDGVATVCTKLFGIAGACRAYFGEKDFQQVAVVRRLVRDLDLLVDVVACPTVRDEDGLALSSRNALLAPEERAVAGGLHRALRLGALRVAQGERDPQAIAAAVAGEIGREPRFRLDRVDVVDADTLDPPGVGTCELRILAAAFLGRARLIDNIGAVI